MIFRIVSPAAIILCSLSLSAQLEVDKTISLTGADGNRMLTNLETPVNGTDAVNKDYVDAAVAATGGSSITLITDESASTMNFGAGLRYCHDLNQSGYTDWRMPTHNELVSVVSNGSISVPNASSANPIYFNDAFMYGTSGIIIKQIRLSDGTYPGADYSTNVQSARVRCVR